MVDIGDNFFFLLRKSLDPLFVKKGMELCGDPVSGKQTKHA
jgi:hypothetical protein